MSMDAAHGQPSRILSLSVFEATQRLSKKMRKESTGKLKPKKHHGNLNNYNFERESFLEDIRAIPEGQTVNWTQKARQYKLTINGRFPLNGGQVMAQYARLMGVNIFKFNVKHRRSGRDYQYRVRRARKRLQHKVTVPSHRPAKKLRQDIRRKVQNKEIEIGEKVVPKVFAMTSINKTGQLTTTEKEIYARKIPLHTIVNEETKRQFDLGILVIRDEKEYEDMTEEEVQNRLKHLGEEVRNDDARKTLRQLERTRRLKMWHDHSDVLNHSYINFMVSFVYDHANFLDDDQYAAKFPERPPVSVQSLVERPRLYLFGQSPSTDADQMMYTETRLDDLKHLHQSPITTSTGVIVFHDLRVFSGDGPARQFESGQQRGGHYPCICGVNAKDHQNLTNSYRTSYLSLDDRAKIVKSGSAWKTGKLNPFKELSKDSLIEELESRGIDTFNLKKPDLQDRLSELLHGIQRQPALLTLYPDKTSLELNFPNYEVLGSEPLHDLCNVIQNIMAELPSLLKSSPMENEYGKLYKSTLADKNQVRGSDARLYLIQVAKLFSTLHENNSVEEQIHLLINALVEVVSLCYRPYKQRSPRDILRLYNQTFIFAVLCKSLIVNPTKMTSRKFYGTHFHSIVVHAPDIARIFCLRSILAEQEERSFGALRKISETTLNRQPGMIVDNAVMRFNAQQSDENRQDYFLKQDTVISQQAKQLPKASNSLIPKQWIKTKSYMVQAHLERIADFLLVGENIWWKKTDSGVEFFDGSDEPKFHAEGPPLHHARSSDLKKEKSHVSAAWSKCKEDMKMHKLILPMTRIRDYSGGNLVYLSASTADSPETNVPRLPPEIQETETTLENQSTISTADTSLDDCPHPYADLPVENCSEDRPLKNYSAHPLLTLNQAPLQSIPVETNRMISVPVDANRDSLTKLKVKQDASSVMNPSNGRKESCKKRLFVEEDTIQSTVETVKLLLGNCTMVSDFVKYRRLTKENPKDTDLKKSYDVALAKVQFAISKKHNELKNGNEKAMKKRAEQLHNHWGIYYY